MNSIANSVWDTASWHGAWLLRQAAAALPLLFTMLLVTLLGVACYKRYLGIGGGRAFVWWMLAVGLGFFLLKTEHIIGTRPVLSRPHFWTFHRFLPPRFPIPLIDPGLILYDTMDCLWVFVALLPALVGLPFWLKLEMKWVGGRLTERDKQPGIEGLRAWLDEMNLACAVLFALSLWLVYRASFWGTLLICVAALVLYPILNSLLSSSQSPAKEWPREDLAEERARVLRMLDEGRITAHESSELLNALGYSAGLHDAHALGTDENRRLMAFGFCLMVGGCLVPWLEGGQLATGGPWMILVLAGGAAILPALFPNLSPQTQRLWTFAALGVGALVLLFLLIGARRELGIGLLLLAGGYMLDVMGNLRRVLRGTAG